MFGQTIYYDYLCVTNKEIYTMRKFYIPVLGIKYYLDTFGPSGRKDGGKAVLFAFWMAFYHGAMLAAILMPIVFQFINFKNI